MHFFKQSPRASLLAALLAAGVGGAVFASLGFPAGWLSGAMLAVALAGLAGLKAHLPSLWRDLAFVLLGLSMGAAVTPDVLVRIKDLPLSLAALSLTVAAIITASFLWLRHRARWDAASAYFASVPGALSAILAVAVLSRGDLSRIALTQALRLLMLVAALPLLVASTGADAAGLPVEDTVMTWRSLPFLLIVGGLGAALSHGLKIPAGLLLGAFIGSGILHGAGLVSGRLPPALEVPALIILGCLLGLRFSGTDFRALFAILLTGGGAFLITLLVAAAGAFVTSGLLDLPLDALLIAFAPGGLEVMVILAFALNADPAFAAAHHLFRFLVLTLLVPLCAPLFLGKGWRKEKS